MKTKKKIDPYRGLKYLGYQMSQLPNVYTLPDLIRYAKFQLSIKTKRLMKDPIWDSYTIEELLSEFYAHQFNESEQFRLKFESELGVSDESIEDFSAWADRQIAEEAKLREKLLSQTEDRIVFDPSSIMGDSDE